MDNKLGFTFYPKDWWTSDTYFELTPFQRYIYLECLFVMYVNDGFLKTQKTQLENRTRTQISDEDWIAVTERFIYDGNFYTHQSVNKRLRKTIANRENGQKGGRPPKTQKTQLENPKKPTLERERESEREREIKLEKNIKKRCLDFFPKNEKIAEAFLKFLSNQKIPKNENQIEALLENLKTFPNEQSVIEGLNISIRAGYPDVYPPKKPNPNEKPDSIWVDGKEHKPQKHGDGWIYPSIIAVEIDTEANTALLSDGSIQPLGQQQKGFKSAEFKFIKKGLIQ
jgi:hypothetical protein